MKPVELREDARICVVLLTGLGDVIHGLPVVNALKRAAPRCRITWVVEPMPAAVLREHPAVDEVVVFRKKEGARGVARLWRDLGGRRFDVTLNFNIYFKSIFPTALSGAPTRLGFDRERARDGVWLFANHRLPPRPRAHTQDMFLEFLEPLGVEPEPLEWRLTATAEEERLKRAFLERAGRPVAAVVPASANRRKDWLPERWAEVVDGLDGLGFAPVIVGGPSERERRIAEEIVGRSRVTPAVELGDGVRRLVWLLGGASLLVAPDTGPVHIARAMETPVIGLYGHTNPWRVGPYRRYQDLWVDAYTEPGTAPDPSSFEPKTGRMERITAADVLGRVERAMERYDVTPAPGRSPGYLPRDT